MAQITTCPATETKRSHFLARLLVRKPRSSKPSLTADPTEESHVFTPTKLISVAGSPFFTPVKQVGRISFDDLIDERSRNVTIKLSMTPQVAM
ncbi:hypothetical protein IWQ60_006653 [Tieghemiomyces parasiticus]|uniref:Uncharacterized protein n=1 Tax=Tieghemiomyces parasiticus TaxID=78921 RepID=A0A9W8A9B8_9FUNG|nr:hypothetical protein IWQ60_006653 [Tieghemiomyces parasiticus]